jgi:acyl-CoA thioesterase-2
VLSRCLLAYMSDFHLLETATLPHGLSSSATDVMMASIDHAMWFHRPFEWNDWLLYALESPSSSSAARTRAR